MKTRSAMSTEGGMIRGRTVTDTITGRSRGTVLKKGKVVRQLQTRVNTQIEEIGRTIVEEGRGGLQLVAKSGSAEDAITEAIGMTGTENKVAARDISATDTPPLHPPQGHHRARVGHPNLHHRIGGGEMMPSVVRGQPSTVMSILTSKNARELRLHLLRRLPTRIPRDSGMDSNGLFVLHNRYRLPTCRCLI